jgi:nickel-dependent lactate racemase
MDLSLLDKDNAGLSYDTIAAMLRSYFQNSVVKGKILVIPPDQSRLHSGAGMITNIFWELCRETGLSMDVMPALGTHEAMTKSEIRMFFGNKIPLDNFLVHNWKTTVSTIGEIPAEFVRDVSRGIMDMPIRIEVNNRIVSGEYAAILSVGQVLPHEVTGFANYTKNILVGVGGGDFINKTHYLGAVAGMENILARIDNPVRAILDYGEKNILQCFPIHYILTVTTNHEDGIHIHGLFAGRSKNLFQQAAELSSKKNIIYVEKPIKKCLVYLDPIEFKSTWIGNKAIYRSRMAIEDDGELIILAPGVEKFGEDSTNDLLIRKYGYVGLKESLRLTKENQDLQENLSVAAQIIQGSSEGRFRVVYCTKLLDKSEIERTGFGYMDYDSAASMYDINRLNPGTNSLKNGEEIYYIPNPALGLWSCSLPAG